MADLRAKLLDLLDGHLRLAEKGTLGEWRVANGKGAASVKGPECAIYLNVRTVEVDECVARWQEDAEWIAASRSFAPMALRAWRAEIERHNPRQVSVPVFDEFDSPWEQGCGDCERGGWPCLFLLWVATALGVEREGGA